MWLICTINVRLLLVIVVEIRFATAEEETKVHTSSNFHTKTVPDSTVCGLKKITNKVIGGNAIEIGEFPWMVALEYKYKSTGQPAGIRCSGSLINSRYVLTAAHCIKQIQFHLTSVRLGEWNVNKNPDCQPDSTINCADPVKKVDIIKKIPYGYHMNQPVANDIALLRLQHDIEYTDYIRPICLPTWNLPASNFGDKLTVAVWGATGYGDATSHIALKVEVPLLPNNNCGILQTGELTRDFLCAGGELGKDACQGDSGGPIMRLYEDTVNRRFQWYQEGLVAYGIACGRAGYPGVYTRVSRYIKWIIKEINKD